MTAAGLEVTATLVPHYSMESYAFRVTDGDVRSPTPATPGLP